MSEDSLRFFVAKFVPNLPRMEPKNIGVLVWFNGHTRARFIGENFLSDKNEWSLKKPPAYTEIDSLPAYRTWHLMWRHFLEQPEIRRDNGTLVKRSSSQFLNALAERSRREFFLAEGGTILSTESELEIDIITEQLFEELVERNTTVRTLKSHPDSRDVERAARKVIREAGIDKLQGFRKGSQQPVPVRVGGKTAYLPFAYTYMHFNVRKRDQLRMAIELVNINKPDTASAAAYNFNLASESFELPRRRRVALTMLPLDGSSLSQEQETSLAIIESSASIIDVRNESHAVEEINHLTL